MTTAIQRHWRVTYRLPAAIEEEWVAVLWSAGTSGVQSLPPEPGAGGGALLAAPEGEAAATVVGPTEVVRLEAWFSEPPETLDGLLDEAAWNARGLLRESCEEVEARDWLAEWRRLARPIPVGRRFLLDPREPEEELRDDDIGDDVGEDAADRLVLLLPARNAFGTGSHESTRLAIELLEAAPLAGATVLDVGTGTGVLAFAALALGARSVVGFDVDPASAVQARLNVALNAAVLGEGASRFAPFAGTGAAIAPTARFDLLLINVLPGRILDQLAPLVATLRPGGALLFSGIVAEQVSTVKSRCGELGLADTAEQRDGEWVAFRFERAGGEVRR